MKTFTKTILACVLLVGASTAAAQTVTIAAPDGAVVPGQVVVVPVNFTSGATALGGLTVDVVVSTSQFSSVAISCAGQGTGALIASCNLPDGASGGKMRFNFAGNATDAFTTGLMGNLTLTVSNSATPNPTELIDGTVSGAGDVTGENDVDVNLITMTDDTLNIVGPAYSSVPVAGGGTEFVFGPVVQGGPLPTQNLVITNSGAGTLSGTCTETSDPGNVFTITDGAYSANAGLNDTVTVACNSSGAIATHTGTMSCTHNAANVASPVIYDLSCQITAGPQPAFAANPNSLSFNAAQEGDVVANKNFTITNSGDNGTTLSSTGSGCTITGADSGKFAIVGGGTFSIPKGNSSIKAVSCDTSAEGNYTAQIDCTHNGSNNPSNNAVALSCVVGPAGAASYVSTPTPGSLLDFTPGPDAVAPNDPSDLILNIKNGATDVNDNDLVIDCGFISGDAEITATDPTSPIAAGNVNGVDITFSCDAASPGNFSAVYECAYGVDGSGTTGGPGSGTATYPVSCDVRGPETQVVPTVNDGTTLTIKVPPGGSDTASVGFMEEFDEDLNPNDAFIQGCEITGDDAASFSITAPGAFPAEIGSGATVNVTVQGTDDLAKESYSANLRCVYSDSSDECGVVEGDAPAGRPELCGTEVNYPLVIEVGGDAYFHVLKEFTDGNPGKVTVDLDCDTGLILDQEKVISDDGIGVTFVVSSFDAGELNCNVTERPVAGYSADYEAGGDSANTDADDGEANPGCYWTAVDGGDNNSCVITNSPDDVNVVITKEWLYPGNADASIVSDEFFLELVCYNASIDGGNKCLLGAESGQGGGGDTYSCKTLSGFGNKVFNVAVNPHTYPGGSCYVTEVDVDQSVEVDNGCIGSGQGIFKLNVSAGSGDSCTITNTVFFEGIPTLSQYGMALLALLMLGMGFVAVRRIT